MKISILGLVIDKRMNCNKHIEDTRVKTEKKFNLTKFLSHTSWAADQKTFLKIHQMIILSTLMYGDKVYGSASKDVLRKLDPIHYRGVRVAFETFAVCKTENVLCKAGLPTLTEMRDENTDRNKYIDEQKPPYQTTNYKPEPLPRLCNENRITKTLLHTSGRSSRTNGHQRKKSPDYIGTPCYTEDGKTMDWSLCKMRKGTPNKIFRAEFQELVNEKYNDHITQGSPPTGQKRKKK
jgi:hypothetical protein